MQTCPKMQAIIIEIAQKHRLDLKQAQAYLCLEQPGNMPLVIEKLGKYELSIVQYDCMTGIPIQDPVVIFLMADIGWIPIEKIQKHNIYQRVADLTPEGEAIASGNLEGIAAIADFAELWAENLREQGWLSLEPTSA